MKCCHPKVSRERERESALNICSDQRNQHLMICVPATCDFPPSHRPGPKGALSSCWEMEDEDESDHRLFSTLCSRQPSNLKDDVPKFTFE